MAKKHKKKVKKKKSDRSFFTKILSFIEANPLIIITLLIITVYGNTLFNGFVWDDEEQIVNNTLIHSLRNIDLFFSGGTFNTGGTNSLSGWFYRPMVNITFSLLYFIFKLNAWGYHLFSVLIHLLNTILFYKILEKFTLQKEVKTNVYAVLIASIFAVHPGILETVTYISAVGDLMVTLAALTSIYLIINYKNTKNGNIPLGMATIIFLGLFYKESAFSLLPIILSLLYLYRKEIALLKNWIGATIIPYLIYFIIRIPLAEKSIQAPHYSPISEATFYERLITIPKVFAHYFMLFFYPHILSVSQHFVVKQITFKDFILPILLIIIFASTLIYLYKKYIDENQKKNFFFSIVLGFFSFGLISNIIPLDMTVAERWFYLPILSLLIISFLLLDQFKDNYKKYSVIFLTLYISFFMTVSFQRNLDWINGLTLYSSDIKVNPNSFDLNNNIGVELFRVGKRDEAKKYFEKSIELQPKWYFAYNNLGVTYDLEENYPKAEELFKKTLEESDYHLAHVNLCRLYTLRIKDYKTAEESCELSVQKLPNNLSLWFYLTIAKYQNGKSTEALDLAKSLSQMAPNSETQYLYNIISKGEKLEL